MVRVLQRSKGPAVPLEVADREAGREILEPEVQVQGSLERDRREIAALPAHFKYLSKSLNAKLLMIL